MVLAMQQFDQLVELLRERYPDVWAGKGEPRGFFTGGVGWRSISLIRARQQLIMEITVTNPSWVKNDSDAGRIRSRYLLLTALIWVVAGLGAWSMIQFMPLQ